MIPVEKLWQRAAFLQAIRSFFQQRRYLEVDTPVRLPHLIPEAHIEPVASGGHFLQTSPEICMKRLLAAGAERIFQICPCFRRNERGAYHLPEFLMLEWYRKGEDYLGLMRECEDLVRHLASVLPAEEPGMVKNKPVTLAGPWPRLTVEQAFRDHAAIPVDQALRQDRFEQCLVEDIEPHLGVERPTFLVDFPAVLASLARLKDSDPGVAERFELYIGGTEIANGFSELTESGEQQLRFEIERKKITEQGRDPGNMPEEFLRAIDAIDTAAGIALGLDRLLMVLTGAESVDEVIPFKPEDL